MIFHRRGSHSKVFDTTSPSLRKRTLAAGARRRLDDPLNRQIVRQRLARRPRSAGTLFLGGLRCCHLGLGLYFGLRLLKVLDGQLELLNKLLAAFG